MPPKPWFTIKNMGNKTAEIYIYGVITDEKWLNNDVVPMEFKAQLDALKDVEEIDLFINSPGGSVFAGLAIHNLIKRCNSLVRAHIDGVAASIASVIAMAADELVMPKNALMMIHNASAIVWGNSADMRKMADALDKCNDAIRTTYMDKVKISEKEVIKMMDAETWMTGEEAVSKGFADKLEESKEVTASIKGTVLNVNGHEMDISKFKAFPKDRIKAEAEAPAAPVEPVAPVPKAEPAPETKTGLTDEEKAATENNKMNSLEIENKILTETLRRF
jgi:ATP-dependent Clp protease, protease subunit